MSDQGSTSQGSSTSAFVTSLIVNGAISIVFFGLFLVLRKRYTRIYEPKSFIKTIPNSYVDPHGWTEVDVMFRAHVEPLPSNKLSWITPLLKSDDVYIIDHVGLDGYFLLRYLRTMLLISLAGCLSWVVLFPVNATGGGNSVGLDVISFSNIVYNNRFYAHVFIGWIFIGFVLWRFTRELYNYTRIRNDYLLRPDVSGQIAMRTILITGIPKPILTESSLSSLFDNRNIEKVWINRDFKTLAKKVGERDKDMIMLENAENKLIKTANKIATKKGRKDVPEDYSGKISSLYLVDKKRPHHKLGKPVLKWFFGQKVDTIDWTRDELARLNPEIDVLQEKHLEEPIRCSAFITFTSLEAAHKAAQSKIPNKGYVPYKMDVTANVAPEDVIWSNTRIGYLERIGRTIATRSFVGAMIIFWTIPVAFVGSLSNINYLTNKVHFLRFILNMPPALLGIITGLLPSILLAVLMAVLPIVLRLMAKLGGVPTISGVEMTVQQSYFLFLIIQAFLVVALSSSASAVVTQIISNPGSALGLLANNLPKSSNFYISYLLLQGLTIASGMLLQLVGLILFYLLGKFLDNTPRKLWKRWNLLSGLGWGTVFPIYANLAVISLVYSIISPLILAFSAIAFLCFYFAHLYNFLYVINPNINTYGLVFPRAIWQTMTGVYLLEVLLSGLFGIAEAWPQFGLMIATIPITALYQIYLQWKLRYSIKYLDTRAFSSSEESATGTESMKISADHDRNTLAEGEKAAAPETKFKNRNEANVIMEPGHNYYHPAVAAKSPIVWIPRDPLGVGKEELELTSAKGIQISDGGATLDEKNKLGYTEDLPDYEP